MNEHECGLLFYRKIKKGEGRGGGCIRVIRNTFMSLLCNLRGISLPINFNDFEHMALSNYRIL